MYPQPRFILVKPAQLVNNGRIIRVDSLNPAAIYYYPGRADIMRANLQRKPTASRLIHQLLAFLPGLLTLLFPVWFFGQDQSSLLSKEEVRRFLLTAEVVKSEAIGKGITHPWRLTLSDGKLSHDASFQDVDVRAQEAGFAGGGRELNFADSFHYNVAAYELASLLELDDMVPIAVEREWKGKKGSLSWWVDDVKMDEEERLAKGIKPPDTGAWNRQMHKVRVFSQLIYDTDRNLQNILISNDWKLWMIDFTRAFRTLRKLPEEKDLAKCEKTLFSKLLELTKEAVSRTAGAHLTKWEIEALMARRDLIAAYFQRLIAEKGESAVLY
ncbi:MAG TPA: hypothetical protein DIW61_16380 [Candidatus Aminicenantes bacterium]|nr:hypothetical protein [Candidatus Aminicenantes bacterium]